MEVLEMIKTDITSSEESVTVLHTGSPDASVAAWCRGQSWPYLPHYSFTGCEDSCVVVLGSYGYSNILEAWSRGKKMLIIAPDPTHDR